MAGNRLHLTPAIHLRPKYGLIQETSRCRLQLVTEYLPSLSNT